MNMECIEWSGHKDYLGYGVMYRNGKARRAHRIVFSDTFGSIPKGMCVCHRCDNRGCVNPDHLFLATHKENMDDCISKGRFPRGETNGLSKLSEIQVREILASNKTMRELGRLYNVCGATIWHIKNRKTWAHV